MLAGLLLSRLLIVVAFEAIGLSCVLALQPCSFGLRLVTSLALYCVACFGLARRRCISFERAFNELFPFVFLRGSLIRSIGQRKVSSAIPTPHPFFKPLLSHSRRYHLTRRYASFRLARVAALCPFHHPPPVAIAFRFDARHGWYRQIRYCSIHQGGIFPGSGDAGDTGPLGERYHGSLIGAADASARSTTGDTFQPEHF